MTLMLLNPFRWSFRAQFFAGFVVCVALLGYALFAQYYLGENPCPLCIFQRVGFVVMGLFFLIGTFHNPHVIGRRMYAILVSIAGLSGATISARHLWIQHLPKDQIPDCGPGLDYMLETFPLGKTLKMVFTGSGECAEITWKFLGLSMPGWVLICYLLLIVGTLWAGFRKRNA